MTTPATPPEDARPDGTGAAPADAGDGQSNALFKEVFPDGYKVKSGLGKYQCLHPTTINRVMASESVSDEAKDVIAALIWDSAIHDDRANYMSRDAQSKAVKVAALEAERDRLAKFKAYVHARLDAAGVPVDPDSPHKAEGCRIGGRLDWVLARLEAGTDAAKSLAVQIRELRFPKAGPSEYDHGYEDGYYRGTEVAARLVEAVTNGAPSAPPVAAERARLAIEAMDAQVEFAVAGEMMNDFKWWEKAPPAVQSRFDAAKLCLAKCKAAYRAHVVAETSKRSEQV